MESCRPAASLCREVIDGVPEGLALVNRPSVQRRIVVQVSCCRGHKGRGGGGQGGVGGAGFETGGGGAGGRVSGASNPGLAGGSGVIILRYQFQ